MKKIKMKNKKTLLAYILIILGVTMVINGTIAAVKWTHDYMFFSYDLQFIEINIKEKLTPEKVYAYNEQVPEEEILREMRSLAERFKINADNWEAVLRVESTCNKNYCEKGKLDNLAKNPVSTALGACQYLIGTWQETESFKQHRKSRTDYKACLWEMALDIDGGQSHKWQESLDILGLNSI